MRKCILIFDDDFDILSVCKIILERENYLVETRLSCKNILSDIKAIQPDIILMDLWIPEMGGEMAIKLVKNNKDTANIPVILFSANIGIEEIKNRVEANGIIKKPFDVTAMLETIKQML